LGPRVRIHRHDCDEINQMAGPNLVAVLPSEVRECQKLKIV
jgi:hypothetical protein